MDNNQIAAAILAAGFATAQRQALSGGRIDDCLREKYIEYLAFVREQEALTKKKSPAVKGKKKK